MDFLEFKIIDFIDIFSVTLIFFQAYKLLKKTFTMKVLYVILSAFILWKLVQALGMELLGQILGAFFSLGFLAFIILFQPEIRDFLSMLSTSKAFNKKFGLTLLRNSNKFLQENTIKSIVNCCMIFSHEKTGALIVIQKQDDLRQYIQGGDDLDVRADAPIMESIFHKNSPLHDGAAIIIKDRIVKTRAILPISYNKNIPLRLGLRHRAAIGISEKTDAIAIVVSEETGHISYIKDQKRILISNPNILIKKLSEDL